MKNYLSIIFFVLTISACQSNQNSQIENNPSNSNEKNTDSAIVTNDSDLKLNNGEKWKVNEEMLIHVLLIDSALNNHSNAEASNQLTDYIDLSTYIDSRLDSVIGNCTMKGESHDELHKWLMPFINTNKDFSLSSDINVASDLYDKLVIQMKDFHTYFE